MSPSHLVVFFGWSGTLDPHHLIQRQPSRDSRRDGMTLDSTPRGDRFPQRPTDRDFKFFKRGAKDL